MPSGFAPGSHFESHVQAQVASGRYRDADEVLRSALRLMEGEEELKALKLAGLRLAIQQGADSGTGTPAETVFDRLERKYQSLVHFP